ncbi:Rieske (2Fe-2S) protein [Patescibacteria group bacterium]|nr:Rieske (2Fe-2S) protein [Patescibacteria group bacterium]MBP9710416.1 Rieske (2Fe-2S) protein [Patescibacteria group bacterium]
MAITRKLPVARVGEILPGHTKTFQFGLAQGIAYNDGGTIKAFVNKCTHMGGPVELKQAGGVPRFRCRWHEAEFDPATGKVLHGQAPAGSMLTPISLTIEGDQLFATLELPPDPFDF